jgi:protein phosphatase
MTESIQFEAHGLTVAGKVRDTNEDHFLIAHLNRSMRVSQASLALLDDTRLLGQTEGHLLVVADGVGGHAAGQVASRIAVDTLVRYVLTLMPWFYHVHRGHEDTIEEELTRALEQCEDGVWNDQEANPQRAGMGTTLTLAYVLGPRLHVVHAGDSRCYLFRNGALEQITTDHTMARELVDAGAWKEREAEGTRASHWLMNVVGGDSESVRPELHRLDLADRDRLLLCSDGLTDSLPDDRIREILREHEDDAACCQTLVEAANEAGGKDNITAVVASLRMT